VPDWGLIAAAFAVGLLGGVHCLGMCGGIVGALSFGLPKAKLGPQLGFQLAYNLGRILSYSLAGALAGGLGLLLAEHSGLAQAQRVLLLIASLFMVLLGLYLGGWWPSLARLERLGLPLWRRLEPLGRGLLPLRSPLQALLLGGLWGWLPCGLVYSNLIWSLSAGGATQGGLLMLAFGLGTLPNLLLMGVLASRLQGFLHRPWVKRLAGASVVLLGLANLWRALL
jgi:sulfite exporter TauE/SafE